MSITLTPYQQAEAEKQYKAEWEASKEIQEEFGGNYAAYAAFRDAQDRGLLPSDRPRRRFTLPQLEEHITLSWQTNYGLRERYASLEAYRSKRFFEEVLGSER